MALAQSVGKAGPVGIGYEGRTISEFIAELHRLGISLLVDVRLTPISRKPGFSKTALGRALSEAGIAYSHYRELGNPKPNRAGFGGTSADLRQARETYAARLREADATQALDDLAAAARQHMVAVLCFEADGERCHRDVVLTELSRRTLTPEVGNTPPAR